MPRTDGTATTATLNTTSRYNCMVGYWLLIGCALVVALVVVGGITRLTGSGLSMVDWRPITGLLPPMTETEWRTEFTRYQTSTEFLQINSDFKLADFKTIFWWEYFHRLLGRFLGLIFVVPFVGFVAAGWLDRRWILKLLAAFALGGLQGLIGWYMVKSGLAEDPHVSHYRLALHLVIALLLVAYLWWLALELFLPTQPAPVAVALGPRILLGSLAVVLITQIVFGAFVSGLKAGLIYPTFPRMGTDWMPPAIVAGWRDTGIAGLLENRAALQFLHRSLAYLVVGLCGAFWLSVRKSHKNSRVSRAGAMLMAAVCLQFLLGVLTLLWAVPLTFAILHQSGAVLILLVLVFIAQQMPLLHRSPDRSRKIP